MPCAGHATQLGRLPLEQILVHGRAALRVFQAYHVLHAVAVLQALHAVRQRPHRLLRMRLLHRRDQPAGLVAAHLRGEIGPPLRLARVVAPAHALLADVADQHRHVARNVRRDGRERADVDHLAVERRIPAYARRQRRPHRPARAVDVVRNLVPRIEQRLPRDPLKRADILGPDVQFAQHAPREIPRLLGCRQRTAAAGLHRGAVDQALAGRHAKQRRHLGAAAGLAVNHHPVGIAAEPGDVLMHPAQGRDAIGHADVGRLLVRRAADFGQIEEPEDVQAVVERHLHHVVIPRHLRPIMRREFIGGAERETAAVEIDHDRTIAGQRRRPDIQLEHVLADETIGPLLKERVFDGVEIVERLRTVRAIGDGVAGLGPALGRLGRQPAVLAASVGTVRNALEDVDVVLNIAANRAVLRSNGRVLRRRAGPRSRANTCSLRARHRRQHQPRPRQDRRKHRTTAIHEWPGHPHSLQGLLADRWSVHSATPMRRSAWASS